MDKKIEKRDGIIKKLRAMGTLFDESLTIGVLSHRLTY